MIHRILHAIIPFYHKWGKWSEKESFGYLSYKTSRCCEICGKHEGLLLRYNLK